jgi:hypothetical protein
MEPEGSLHFSQKPVTGHYPEPDESNQRLSILLQYYFMPTFLIWRRNKKMSWV